MPFSATIHPVGSAAVRLDVHGQVVGAAVDDLTLLIITTIVGEAPDMLLIDLRHVTALSGNGVRALLTGYATAIDYGTSFHVVHASGTARYSLQLTGTLDLLADSNDLGALLLAVSGAHTAGSGYRHGW
ncbi:MAG TPA: STAS domain-containing protein [Pseudonocardiaceae bacterium]|jgi:anti-anti-sigma regulatory factor